MKWWEVWWRYLYSINCCKLCEPWEMFAFILFVYVLLLHQWHEFKPCEMFAFILFIYLSSSIFHQWQFKPCEPWEILFIYVLSSILVAFLMLIYRCFIFDIRQSVASHCVQIMWTLGKICIHCHLLGQLWWTPFITNYHLSSQCI